MKFFNKRHNKDKSVTRVNSIYYDKDMLKFIAGGLDDVLPECTNHDWVLSGSRTDVTTNVTWNYYKCLKCGAEKTERA